MTDTATTLVSVQSEFQRVEIRAHEQFGNQLWLDGDLQISEADASYNTAMVCPLLMLEHCERVVILGGGDGGVLHELGLRFDEAQRPQPAAKMVDIDPVVMDLCDRHLPRLCGDVFRRRRDDIVVGDAFAFIDEQRNLDAVIYDLTMDPVREQQSRAEFIAETLERIDAALRPGGMLTMQCCGHGLNNPDDARDRELLIGEIRAALHARFEPVVEQDVLVPSYEDLWTFAAAFKPAA